VHARSSADSAAERADVVIDVPLLDDPATLSLA
jgi:hypothetical protein